MYPRSSPMQARVPRKRWSSDDPFGPMITTELDEHRQFCQPGGSLPHPWDRGTLDGCAREGRSSDYPWLASGSLCVAK